MTNEVVTESLIQKGKTPFFNDLVALYKESFNEVRKLPSITGGNVLMTLKAIDLKGWIKSIFKAHMNIDLTMVTIEDSIEPNLICWLFMDSPSYLKNTKQNLKSAGMMMDKINQFYDDKTGRYESHQSPVQSYQFGLTLFTSLWTLLNKDGNFYLEPEELAAATLHEAGHIDHFIRASKRIYANTLDASEIVTYLKQTPDRDVVLALLKKIRQSTKLDKSWFPILEATEKYFKTSNSLDSQEYYEALSVLGTLVTAEVADFNLTQINTTAYNLGPAERVVETRLINLDVERSADEFAARNGTYQYLNSMTGKLQKLATYQHDIFLRQFMWSAPAVVAGYLNYFGSLFQINAEDIANGYDPIIRRMELVVETAKHAFSNMNLSDEIKAEIHRQIVVSEDYIKQYKSTQHQQIRSKIKQWKDNVGKFGRVLASPIQNRLSQDYERLQDANRSLSRNSLYYLANKK